MSVSDESTRRSQCISDSTKCYTYAQVRLGLVELENLKPMCSHLHSESWPLCSIFRQNGNVNIPPF